MNRISLAGRSLAFVLPTLVALAAGCGDDSGVATRYPVTGKVSYKGQPVEKGVINFHAEDPTKGRSASGTIKNGTYTLTTVNENDGALPGKYAVTIESRDVDLSKAQANVKGGSLRQDDVAKANRDAKSNLPSKYSLPGTSGLTATVEAKSNTANFDLTD